MLWEPHFDPSQAIARIRAFTPTHLNAEARGGSPAMLLEALAQACGLHVRWRSQFLMHTRLVSMGNVCLRPACGTRVIVRICAETSQGVGYLVEADFLTAAATVTLALVPATTPQTLFQKRFQWLAS